MNPSVLVLKTCDCRRKTVKCKMNHFATNWTIILINNDFSNRCFYFIFYHLFLESTVYSNKIWISEQLSLNSHLRIQKDVYRLHLNESIQSVHDTGVISQSENITVMDWQRVASASLCFEHANNLLKLAVAWKKGRK